MVSVVYATRCKVNRAEAAHINAGLRGLERSLPLALLKAREAAMSHFRPMLRGHGLTEQQWRVIRILAAFPDIDASEIVQRSYLLAPSLTRILHYLESEKIITRMQNETDLRRSYFALTQKGRRLYDARGTGFRVDIRANDRTFRPR